MVWYLGVMVWMKLPDKGRISEAYLWCEVGRAMAYGSVGLRDERHRVAQRWWGRGRRDDV